MHNCSVPLLQRVEYAYVGETGYRQLMDIEFHRKLAKHFIKDSDNTGNKSVRVQ